VRRSTYVLIAVGALATAACHAPRKLEHVLVAEPVIPSADELSPAETATLAPRIARLRLMPDSIVLAPGEVYGYAMLQVVALDSAGAVLGRLRVYDTAMEPGAAVLLGGRELQGVHPGVSELVVRFPRALWTGSGDPPAPVKVRVIVKAPAAGRSTNDR